jgi:hypothetical protein
LISSLPRFLPSSLPPESAVLHTTLLLQLTLDTLDGTQNIGLALFPLAVAGVHNHSDRYIPGVELLFVSFGVVGSLVGVALNVVDYRSGSILNGSSASQTKIRAASLMLDEEAELDGKALLANEY